MYPDWYKLWYNIGTGKIIHVDDREHEDYYTQLVGNLHDWVALGVINSGEDSGAYARVLIPLQGILFVKIKAVILKYITNPRHVVLEGPIKNALTTTDDLDKMIDGEIESKIYTFDNYTFKFTSSAALL